MDLKKVLGFTLEPVRIHPDGASTPPEVSALAPPSEPAAAVPAPRQFEATRIEGLVAPAPLPPPPPPPPRAPEPATPQAQLELPRPAADRGVARAPEPDETRTPEVNAKAQRAPLSPRYRALASIAAGSSLLGFVLSVFLPRLAAVAERQRPRASHEVAAGAAPVWQDSIQVSTSPCVRQREPERVAAEVSPTFPLEASATRGSVEVLVGEALASNAAVGLAINATTLLSKEVLRDEGARDLLGVVPTSTGELSRFVVDRAGIGGYRELRTLPSQALLALGRTNGHLHLVRQNDQRSVPLWAIGSEEEISRPRVEWQDAERLALTLRRGGRNGKVVIGWLDQKSLQHSILRELPLEGREVGLPSLSIQKGRAAIAAAVRKSNDAPWRIQVAISEWFGTTRRVALPDLRSGSEEDTFAPSIVSVGESRWFLQWTAGQQGKRRVRAITLDANFAPLGEPINVSSPGSNAGGGLALAVDQGLLSLFLIQRGTSYELWVTPLSCI